MININFSLKNFQNQINKILLKFLPNNQLGTLKTESDLDKSNERF